MRKIPKKHTGYSCRLGVLGDMASRSVNIAGAGALLFPGANDTLFRMKAQTAFQRGVDPLLQLILPGKVDEVISIKPDPSLLSRIEELASKNTEGELSDEEREEYAGYVRANKFVAVLRREAMKFKSHHAA